MKISILIIISVMIWGIQMHAQGNAGAGIETKMDSVAQNASFEDFLSLVSQFFESRTLAHFRLENFEWWRILFFVIGISATMILARIIRWFVENYLAKFALKSKSDLDSIICIAVGKPLSLLIFSAGLYLSAIPVFVMTTDKVVAIFGRICLAIAATAISWAVYRMVEVLNHVLLKYAERSDNNLDEMIVDIIRKFLKVAIVAISLMLIGQNILNLNITALLAGAGVVGLAISFGAQNTIANFFSSITIVLDQPFKIGERIVTDKYDGTVEYIGFRSTKIRTLEGHLVTIPNNVIANTSIENISRRESIRILNNITVVYDTSPEKMQEAVQILRNIYAKHECMKEDMPPRIYFNAFNDWALNIIVIAWYHSSDYWAFQDWNHRMNLEILNRFSKAGIEFAFPTSTTYLAHDPKRKLEISLKEGKNTTL